MSYTNDNLFQNLEDRRMMSSSLAYDAVVPVDDAAPTIDMPLARDDDAGWASQPMRRQASTGQNNWLIGNWSGAAKISALLGSTKVGFSLKVIAVSAKSFTGTLNVHGATVKGTFPFKVTGTNQFSMTINRGDFTGTVRGTVDTSGKIGGKISGMVEGLPFSGKVSMMKQL